MKTSVKNILIAAGKILLFVSLFVSLFLYSNNVLLGGSTDSALRMIVRQPDDTYDVILAGPSHMQWAIQPAQLFGEHGIVSCNSASAAQSIPSSYYVIKELINRHDPELVVIDIFCMFCPDKYFFPARLHQALDHFPLSRDKIEAIEDLAQEDKQEYYLPYMMYHGRWKSLEEEDYDISADFHETYQLLRGVTPFEDPFVPVGAEETAEIPAIPLDYLKRLADLCKETDTKLLITVIPYRADVDNNDVTAVYQQQMYNTMEQLAKEWDVDFLNGLHYLDEMGFDFTTDMVEYSHVNASGAEKISTFYGKYMAEHYDLPDHSQNEKYTDWHQYYKDYLEFLEIVKVPAA